MSDQPSQNNAPEQTEGLHITHDKNGRKLPNVQRAGGEFTAEDVRFMRTRDNCFYIAKRFCC